MSAQQRRQALPFCDIIGFIERRCQSSPALQMSIEYFRWLSARFLPLLSDNLTSYLPLECFEAFHRGKKTNSCLAKSLNTFCFYLDLMKLVYEGNILRHSACQCKVCVPLIRTTASWCLKVYLHNFKHDFSEPVFLVSFDSTVHDFGPPLPILSLFSK